MSRELLEQINKFLIYRSQLGSNKAKKLSKDLEKYLAQPDHEPVAWMCPNDPDVNSAFKWKKSVCLTRGCSEALVPVYTAPPDQSARIAELEQHLTALQAKRKPLSDDEIEKLAEATLIAFTSCGTAESWVEGEIEFARAIEAAHGITGEYK